MRTESKIYGAFRGWRGGRLFKLTNGQLWLQAEHKYQYKYIYRPKVVITREAGDWQMTVEGMEDTVRVRRTDAIEAQIEGTFNGWSGDTVFKLTNGQTWKQASYAYWYHYAHRPEIIIYESGSGSMLVLADDDSEAVEVRRLR